MENVDAEKGPSDSGESSQSDRAAHDRRNEVHAIWLGIQLLQDQLDRGNWQDARMICQALRESAERLRAMESRETGEPGTDPDQGGVKS